MSSSVLSSSAAALSDAELDVFRQRTDPVLDALLATLPPEEVGQMLGKLFKSDTIPLEDERFARLCARLPPVPVAEPAAVAAGQQLFQLFGPEILLILGCYALPAAYAAADGVQVIYRARRLKDDGLRRLTETAQMLINVMHPGGLEPDGIGTRSARKVRLMHALVRRHVRSLKEPEWSPRLGEPINQEDLAGTLLTFSLVVLDGLRKIGAHVSPEAERGYFAVWDHLAEILGIDERLRPRDFSSAMAFAQRIAQRQFRATPEGQSLARDLSKVLDDLFVIPGYGTSLMRFFLDGSVFGLNLAELLGLPPPNWTRHLVRSRAAQKHFVLRWLPRVPGAQSRRRAFSGFFTQRLILLQRPDKHCPFEVPPGLLEAWRLQRRAPRADRSAGVSAPAP
ncbi:MAG: hypothetical protein RL685_5857 [Pseudomonadota bacterium]|jgi:hypothetical protein